MDIGSSSLGETECRGSTNKFQMDFAGRTFFNATTGRLSHRTDPVSQRGRSLGIRLKAQVQLFGATITPRRTHSSISRSSYPSDLKISWEC